MKGKISLLFFLTMIFTSTSVMAMPTNIKISVKTKDAKFLGTSMGGALVILKDADTEETLAKGVTSGGTGNTKLIMNTPLTRGTAITDAKPANFTTTIDIDRPTLVEVTAFGPLSQRQAANRVSATQWVMPGKDITGGDGWVLEIPGFVVDIQAPSNHIKLTGAQDVQIQANLTMM